jgi:hypothetical protein
MLYDRIGTITIPVYQAFPCVLLPDGARKTEDGLGYTTDCTGLLEMMDDRCTETCESIKTDLEEAVTSLLLNATVEELVALRGAGLI